MSCVYKECEIKTKKVHEPTTAKDEVFTGVITWRFLFSGRELTFGEGGYKFRWGKFTAEIFPGGVDEEIFGWWGDSHPFLSREIPETTDIHLIWLI